MKIKKYLCFITTIVIAVTALAGNAAAYYNGSASDTGAYRKKINGITYVLKENVQYGDKIKVPYSASVVEIPNAKKVQIPEKVSYDGLKFLVTDIDLCGEYPITENNIPTFKQKYTKVEEIVLPDTIYNITRFDCFPNVQKINIPKNAAIGRHYSEGFIDYTSNNPVIDKTIYYSEIGSTRVAFFQFADGEYEYFYNCPKLTLTVNSKNPYYKYENNLLLSKDGKKVYLSLNHSKEIEIPEGVESINSNGGFGFYDVEKVKLPGTLKYLGGTWCSISKISLPSGLEEIGPEAFSDSYLDKIVIPDSVKKIGDSVFACSTIKSIKFGKNLKTISSKAFKRCNNLKSVTIPKNIKVVDTWAFKKCKNLKSVNILSENVKINYRAFAKCPSLKKVTMNKTKEIPSHAFVRCTHLKTVTIKEVKKIDIGAFYGCKKLSKVVINNKKKAPKIEKRAFKNTKSGIKFYVKNKKVAKSLRKQLKGSGVRNAKILVSKSCV